MPPPLLFARTEKLTKYIECGHAPEKGHHAVLRSDVKKDQEIIEDESIMRPCLFSDKFSTHCYYCFAELAVPRVPERKDACVREERRRRPHLRVLALRRPHLTLSLRSLRRPQLTLSLRSLRRPQLILSLRSLRRPHLTLSLRSLRRPQLTLSLRSLRRCSATPTDPLLCAAPPPTDPLLCARPRRYRGKLLHLPTHCSDECRDKDEFWEVRARGLLHCRRRRAALTPYLSPRSRRARPTPSWA